MHTARSLNFCCKKCKFPKFLITCHLSIFKQKSFYKNDVEVPKMAGVDKHPKDKQSA